MIGTICMVGSLFGKNYFDRTMQCVVSVQAKTSFDYSERALGEIDYQQSLQEKFSQVTIEEQRISTAIQQEEARKAEKARVDAEEARLTELLLRQQEQKEQDEAAKQALVDQKVQEQEAAAAAAAAQAAQEAAAQEALLEQQRLEQEAAIQSQYVIQLSSSERDILERIVHAEAGNQDIKGRMLVANVVLNRVRNPKFPDTVKEVVFEHSGNTYQFSPAKSGSVNRVKVTDLTREAVSRVLKGEDYSDGALFFVARSAANKNSLSWFDTKLTRLFTHGGHTFYK